MQDISTDTNDVRSIRNIPVPQGRRAPLLMQQAPAPHKRGGGSFLLKLLALCAIAVIAAVGVASFFPSATISVYVHQASLTLPATLQAQLEGPVGVLSFQLISASKQATQTVTASGTTNVSTSASGTVTIFNSYSSASQTLVANTRFQSPDGKIYRIHKTVTVPGMKSSQLGSVEATVYADQPGAAYNASSTRFTIPGFNGTPRASAFYAQADGLTGGFSGTRPSVSANDLQTAQDAIKQNLASALATSSAFQVPGGSLPIGGTIAMTFGDVQVVDAGGGKATVSQSATSTEAIVPTGDVASALAKLQVQGYAGEAVNFTDPSSITLALAPNAAYAAQTSALAFTVTGSSSIAWQFDPYQIQQALVGKSKGSFESLMTGFAPAITKANASMVPFWETSFPANSAKIKIVVAKS